MLDLVKLVNVGDEDFVDRFNSQRYLIPAGSEKYVPWGAVVTWLGDPSLLNNDKQKLRTNEFNRVKVRYGCYDVKGWEKARPKLETYTQDGQRIYTVAEDPDNKRGVQDLDFADTETLLANNQRDLEKQISMQQKMMQEILAVLTPEQRAALSGEKGEKDGEKEKVQTEKPSHSPAKSSQTPPKDSPTRPKAG